MILILVKAEGAEGEVEECKQAGSILAMCYFTGFVFDDRRVDQTIQCRVE